MSVLTRSNVGMTQGASMALDAIGIKRNRVLVAAPVRVLPSESITLWAQLGAVGGDLARFRIIAAGGQVVFGPAEKRTDIFSSQVNLDTVAPAVVGQYTLEVTELRPLFPDDTKTMGFEVTTAAPPPPAPPAGWLGQLQPLLIAGVALVGLVVLSPVIDRIAGSAQQRRN